MSTAIVVANIPIRQDVHGRYHLNTLHQASEYAEDEKKSPSQWMRRKSTKRLIQELESLSVNLHLDVVKGGESPGTYAHELLAVSYAGWISPKFQLAVNQAFIDSRQPIKPLTILSPAQMLLEAAQQLVDHEIQLTEHEARLERLEAHASSHTGYLTLLAYCRQRKISLPLKALNMIGQKLRKKADRLGLKLGKIPDERWGTVNSYPLELLDEEFSIQPEGTIS